MTTSTHEINRRRTFAIVSHPDAGKTTLTEKLLLFGGAIQLAGTIKGKKAARHATSDWLELEKQRGISVTTSVMQFTYQDCIINLLDTPGHADFTEDTYRTLTAVDAALMVIDAAKGVEPRTIKLMEVCRLRNTPITTFINKMDRDSLEPTALLDNIEKILKIQCIPITWPLGSGKSFIGIYHFERDVLMRYQPGSHHVVGEIELIQGIDHPRLTELADPALLKTFKDEVHLIREACGRFERNDYLQGKTTPVFFGSAINNFGVQLLLDAFLEHAPGPQPRATHQRIVTPDETAFTGFVFKIQANMDPAHRDRIAFLRIASGHYHPGIKLYHVRLDRHIPINNALTFMAATRTNVEEAWAGDILGLHNHGTIQIGDTFTQGETLQFSGIPNFAPELFRAVRLKDPLKHKTLQKGLVQLSEEGATQIFKPLDSNEMILGAVGILQFDVVAYRLQHEYQVQCVFEPTTVALARWIYCNDKKKLEQFTQKCHRYLAYDASDQLTYLAPSRVNLEIAIEQWPEIIFAATREQR